MSLVCGNFRQQMQTTADGSYSISAPQGTYTLEVQSPGYETLDRSVNLSEGGELQLDCLFHLSRPVHTRSGTRFFHATPS